MDTELNAEELDRVITDASRQLESIWKSSPLVANARFADSPGIVGPAATAATLIVRHHLTGKWRDEDLRVGRALVAAQRSDGSFVASPFDEHGHVESTLVCGAALSILPIEDAKAASSRALAFVEEQTTLAQLGKSLLGDPFMSALYAAVAGVVPATSLPDVPTRAPTIPPLRHLLERRINLGALVGMVQYGVVARRLRGQPPHWLGKNAELELSKSLRSDNGSWNDSVHQTLLGLLSLQALGESADGELIGQGLAWLDTNRREFPEVAGAVTYGYAEFASPVWTTAMAMRASMATGVDVTDPTVLAGARYLAAANANTRQLAEDNPGVTGQALTGGWAFQADNPLLPDADDTGFALGTMGVLRAKLPADHPDRTTIDASVNRAVQWLMTMQNADGGFASYTRGLPGKKRGPLYEHPLDPTHFGLADALKMVFDPPPELGDPSTEDVTGRVLFGLGRCGFRKGTAIVDRAIEFIREQQLEDGSWWGRWICNYLAGTAWVLIGTSAVGFTAHEVWVERAIRYIEGHQNDDGGWGELPASYRSPLLSGKGPSMPGLTGLVTVALLSLGQSQLPATRRAIDYLVRSQQTNEGGWPANDWVHTFVPPALMYSLPSADLCYPLEALGMFRAGSSVPTDPGLPSPEHRPSPKKDGVWSAEDMAPWRHVGDAVADDLVAEIFRSPGGLEATNTIFGHLVVNDDQLPAHIAAPLRSYLERPVLPAWYEPQRGVRARAAFAEHGWAIAATLMCSGLPQAYAAAKGAAVLTQTQGLSKHTKRRILETAQFLFDVMEPDGFAPAGRGIRAIQKVRLMHATVRHLLSAKGWDYDLGTPINQMDIAGTMLTFSVVATDGLAKLGIQLGPDVVEDYLHTWKAIAWALGLDEAFLPSDMADAQALRTTIIQDQWAPSEAGGVLARQLLETMQSYYSGPGSKSFPSALIRDLCGDECADILGIERAPLSEKILEKFFDLRRFLHLMPDDPREADWRSVFSLHLLEGMVLAQREGKQTRFRLPATLRRQWKLSD